MVDRPHIVLFDLETRLGADEIGWERLRRGEGGISALAIYDNYADWTFLYDDIIPSPESAARRLEAADLVISWNGLEFDIPVLEGVLGRKLKLHAHWDLYLALKRELGEGRRKGSGMGPTAERTLGISKLGSGEHAPELAKENRMGELFNYCSYDVYVLRSLVRHVAAGQPLIGPEGQKVIVRKPSILQPGLL